MNASLRRLILALALLPAIGRADTTAVSLTMDSGTVPSGMISQNATKNTVVSSATLDPSGTGNYVLQNTGTTSLYSFSALALQGTSNTITFTLNFSFASAAATNTFDVGLYNSNGTAAAAANISGATGLAADDFGLFAEVKYSANLIQLQPVIETGDAAAGIFFGTDRNYGVAKTGTVSYPSGETNAHTLTLTVAWNAAGYYTYTYGVDVSGSDPISGTGTTSGLTTFNSLTFNPDELVISAKSGTVLIDKLTVTTTAAVPEPSTWLLAALGGLLLLAPAARRRVSAPIA